MVREVRHGESLAETRILPHAPRELTSGRLVRLGEGIGKVVYASAHWVVKRERRPSEILALVALWRALRQFDQLLPGGLGRRLLERPGRQIRLLRFLFQVVMATVPKGFWFMTHVGSIWRTYLARAAKGEEIAAARLAGTTLIPLRVTFPPTRVRVGSWPGWLMVSEATERVEMTLHDRINDLARALRFDEIEVWLNRLLETRLAGWQRGVFSLDAHLKNFGVAGDHVVLLDYGGLTTHWPDVENRLAFDDEPHVQLGLEMTLRDRPDIAERFDAQWRVTVNPEVVRSCWQRGAGLQPAADFQSALPR